MLFKTSLATVTAGLLLLTMSHVDAEICTCGDMINGDPEAWPATDQCCEPPVGVPLKTFPPRCAILPDEYGGYTKHSRRFVECRRAAKISEAIVMQMSAA